jgi:four helix bundle protein
MPLIRSHRELDIYRRALGLVAVVSRVARAFPPDEKFDLVAQIRASSRSVCSCIAEAWRKRNYPAAFASKLTDGESEAAETQTWIDVARVENYLSKEESDEIINGYEVLLGQLVRFRMSAHQWKPQP